jgi:UDP-N-acetyl-2-amino-2-deoxyglucuronate dehydrogenase
MAYRFAIIGCGTIAARHAEHIQSLGTLVAVCDILPERAREFGERYKVPAYGDLQILLRHHQPDVVTVCTPNGFHFQPASTALQAGCHVLCEKPLTNRSADAQKLVETAAIAKRRLFVVKQNRYNAPVAAIKKLLDAGTFGRISGFQVNCFWNRPDAYYANSWRGTLDIDGGSLFTQFSHFIDLIYWFLGDLEQASGWRANFFHANTVEFEDTGAATLLMKSGAIGSLNYTTNAHRSNLEGSFTLFGERGTAKIGGQYLNLLEHFSVTGQEAPVLPQAKPANSYGYYEGSMSNHRIVYEELIRALNDPLYRSVEAAEALKSVEMIEMIYRSSPFVNVAR